MAKGPSRQESPSRRHVWRMFDRIAPRYDLLNRLLSFRRDVAWRKELARYLPAKTDPYVLDLATGTADTLLFLRKTAHLSRGVGGDLSAGMLRVGQAKLRQNGADKAFPLIQADATRLGIADELFDAVTIVFGIRNVMDVSAALSEIRRVLKPGGRALILEFSMPPRKVFCGVYLLYFRHILPRLGGWISGDRAAYEYLNQSAETFPCGAAFCGLMQEAGFVNIAAHPVTFGIATIYTGNKTE